MLEHIIWLWWSSSFTKLEKNIAQPIYRTCFERYLLSVKTSVENVAPSWKISLRLLWLDPSFAFLSLYIQSKNRIKAEASFACISDSRFPVVMEVSPPYLTTLYCIEVLMLFDDYGISCLRCMYNTMRFMRLFHKRQACLPNIERFTKTAVWLVGHDQPKMIVVLIKIESYDANRLNYRQETTEIGWYSITLALE